MHDTILDEDLVRLFLTGDNQAFDEIYSRHRNKVFKLAINIIRNRTDAEDAVQDIFTQVFKKLNSFEFKCKFSSWLYRMSVNVCLMKLRSQKRKSIVLFSQLEAGEEESILSNMMVSSDTLDYHHELRGVLENAISSLPEHYAVVFILKDVDQLTIPEISFCLSIDKFTLKNRLHSARQKIKKQLQSYIEIVDEAA
jgi:RNA polymerase sigma-70 factor (ECF subfamily)